MDESRWKLETGDSLKEGIIHSQKVKGRGKVYRLQVVSTFYLFLTIADPC